jgi:hypothetical protein
VAVQLRIVTSHVDPHYENENGRTWGIGLVITELVSVLGSIMKCNEVLFELYRCSEALSERKIKLCQPRWGARDEINESLRIVPGFYTMRCLLPCSNRTHQYASKTPSEPYGISFYSPKHNCESEVITPVASSTNATTRRPLISSLFSAHP